MSKDKEPMENTKNNTILCKYELLEELGRGATSQVYLARHLKLKTYRAIKRISKAHQLQSQFRLEAYLMKNLSESHIPVLYDMEEDDEYSYYIEEYVEGRSLKEFLLYHNQFSQEFVLQLGIQLCEWLCYLHSRKPYPICYLDLKPGHIMLNGNQIKIIDYGNAIYLSPEGKPMIQDDSQTGGYREANSDTWCIGGTYPYAPPEQQQGTILSTDMDLYAVGMVLQACMNCTRERIDKRFQNVLEKATNSNDSKRYHSAKELKRDLECTSKHLKRVKKGKKHLNDTIAIVGATAGCGTTHIAIALTEYLNLKKQKAIYQAKGEKDVIEVLYHQHFLSEDGMGGYKNGYFYGYLKDCEKEEMSEEVIHIYDYGTDWKGAIAGQADITVLVMGGSIWQCEEDLRIADRMKNIPGIQYVCGFGHYGMAKQYANTLQTRVYGYPLENEELQSMWPGRWNRIGKGRKAERRNAIFFDIWRQMNSRE